MSISGITVENLEACAELFVEVFNQPPWSESWTISQAIERLQFYFDTPNFIGACFYEGEELLGFVLGNYEPYQSENLYILKEMCVSLESQGKGVGSSLVKHIHALLKTKGISTVNLITKVDGLAERFYLKNGYYKSHKMGLYVARFNT